MGQDTLMTGTLGAPQGSNVAMREGRGHWCIGRTKPHSRAHSMVPAVTREKYLETLLTDRTWQQRFFG